MISEKFANILRGMRRPPPYLARLLHAHEDKSEKSMQHDLSNVHVMGGQQGAAAEQAVTRASDFRRFIDAMTDGTAAAKYGHLDGRTPKQAPKPKPVVAAAPGLVPTADQQRAFDEQVMRDRGDLLTADQSNNAAKLILSAAKRTRGEAPDEPVEMDPHEDDQEDKKSKKKNKRAKDTEDRKEEDDTEDDSDAGTNVARIAERRRVKAIVTCQAAQSNLVAAWWLACETELSAADATAMLSMMESLAATQRKDSLRDRMSSEVNTNVGFDRGDQTMSTSDFIVLQDRRRRGEVPV
jgi:hypothetical protein